MENKNKLYIVSFSDSNSYRLPFIETPADDGLHHADMTPLAEVEKELNAFLKKQFPDESFAYYTTPRVTEVEWEHRDNYADYPLLDAAAIEEIKKILLDEIRDMNSNRMLNDNAPFAQI